MQCSAIESIAISSQANGTKAEVTFENVIETEKSRQTIFIPETEEELQRFFEGELEGWRVFYIQNNENLAIATIMAQPWCVVGPEQAKLS